MYVFYYLSASLTLFIFYAPTKFEILFCVFLHAWYQRVIKKQTIKKKCGIYQNQIQT